MSNIEFVVFFVFRDNNSRQLVDILRQLLARQIQQSEQIEDLKTTVATIQARLSRPKPQKDPFPITNTILAVVVAIGLQVLLVMFWFGDGKMFPDMQIRK